MVKIANMKLASNRCLTAVEYCIANKSTENNLSVKMHVEVNLLGLPMHKHINMDAHVASAKLLEASTVEGLCSFCPTFLWPQSVPPLSPSPSVPPTPHVPPCVLRQASPVTLLVPLSARPVFETAREQEFVFCWVELFSCHHWQRGLFWAFANGDREAPCYVWVTFLTFAWEDRVCLNAWFFIVKRRDGWRLPERTTVFYFTSEFRAVGISL